MNSDFDHDEITTMVSDLIISHNQTNMIILSTNESVGIDLPGLGNRDVENNMTVIDSDMIYSTEIDLGEIDLL